MKIGSGAYAAAAAAVAAVGILLAGCGGGDDGAATTALSQAELAAQAAPICRSADQRIEAAAHKYLGSGRPSAKDLERFATVAVVPETQRAIDHLGDLTPPTSDAQAYDDLIVEMQSVNDRLKADPHVLAEHGDPFAKSNKLARQAGLDACSAD